MAGNTAALCILGTLRKVGWATAPSVISGGSVQSRQVQTVPDIKGLSRSAHQGMSGVGLPAWQWPKSTPREERSMIQDEVQNLEEEGSKLHQVHNSMHLEGGLEPPQENYLVEWTVPAGELQQILSPPSSVGQLTGPCSSRGWGRTHCGDCVGIKVQWRTFCQGARPRCYTGDMGGAMTRCWHCSPGAREGEEATSQSKTIAEHHHHPQPSRAEPPASHPEMGNGGWPGEESPLSRGSTVLRPETRHHHVVIRGEEDHSSGADGAGGRLWGGEKKQMPATCPGLQG